RDASVQRRGWTRRCPGSSSAPRGKRVFRKTARLFLLSESLDRGAVRDRDQSRLARRRADVAEHLRRRDSSRARDFANGSAALLRSTGGTSMSCCGQGRQSAAVKVIADGRVASVRPTPTAQAAMSFTFEYTGKTSLMVTSPRTGL